MKFEHYFPCIQRPFGPNGESQSPGGITYSYDARFTPIGVGAVDEYGRIWRYCLDKSVDVLSPPPAWVHISGENYIVEKA